MRATLFLLLCTLGAFACGSATTAAHGPFAPSSGVAREGEEDVVVAMAASQFDYSPNLVRAKKGRPLIFELTSKDRVHGFSLPAFGVRTDVKPGETVRVRVVPDKAGTFVFHCDVFCGDGHEGMTGQLIVE